MTAVMINSIIKLHDDRIKGGCKPSKVVNKIVYCIVSSFNPEVLSPVENWVNEQQMI